jgi:hypothetical protein
MGRGPFIAPEDFAWVFPFFLLVHGSLLLCGSSPFSPVLFLLPLSGSFFDD